MLLSRILPAVSRLPRRLPRHLPLQNHIRPLTMTGVQNVQATPEVRGLQAPTYEAPDLK